MLNIVTESEPNQTIDIEIIRGSRKNKFKFKSFYRPRLGVDSDFFLLIAIDTIPNSYKIQSGIASKICETTSGGVNMAPITKAPTITYGLYS